MKALVIDPTPAFHAGYPDPIPASGESIVRVELAGICGTDLELARGYMGYRGVPGHEFVGRVVESASPALRGRRVVGEINAACGRCSFCIDGIGRHCLNRTVLGIVGRDGAFAEFLRLPDRNLRMVSDALDDERAVFTEPLAAAYEIFEQLHLPRNQSMAVLGAGRLGAMVALALRAEGYLPVVAGHHKEKLERLSALGLRTIEEPRLDEKFDYVVDCTGRGDGLRRAIELVKARGTIILKSTAAAGADLNLAPVVINEITVVGSRCGRFEPALEALETGRVDPRPLIDATFPLEDAVSAMSVAAQASNFKILLKPS